MPEGSTAPAAGPAFIAMRYATLAVDWDASPSDAFARGWRVRARDAAGYPLVLVDAAQRIACLLFRPESLLSDRAALELLREALDSVAAPLA